MNAGISNRVQLVNIALPDVEATIKVLAQWAAVKHSYKPQ